MRTTLEFSGLVFLRPVLFDNLVLLGSGVFDRTLTHRWFVVVSTPATLRGGLYGVMSWGELAAREGLQTSYQGYTVDVLAPRSDERRGMAAISFGELLSKLGSGDF